jgi:hypothetical protein
VLRVPVVSCVCVQEPRDKLAQAQESREKLLEALGGVRGGSAAAAAGGAGVCGRAREWDRGTAACCCSDQFESAILRISQLGVGVYVA